MIGLLLGHRRICVWIDVDRLSNIKLRLMCSCLVHGVVLRVAMEAIARRKRHHAHCCHSNGGPG